jgi:putative ABC transport system ATP-binding protein
MPMLEISHLKKSFIGPDGEEHRVVDVKYFTLAAKAHVAIQGDSGSGKTTFLHLIAGILKPDSGTVLLTGQEMSSLKESQRDRLRAGAIGYIFQASTCFKATPASRMFCWPCRLAGVSTAALPKLF